MFPDFGILAFFERGLKQWMLGKTRRADPTRRVPHLAAAFGQLLDRLWCDAQRLAQIRKDA